MIIKSRPIVLRIEGILPPCWNRNPNVAIAEVQHPNTIANFEMLFLACTEREISKWLAGGAPTLNQLEVGEGGGLGFECGNGFDEAGDREGVADAAGTTYQAQDAAFAGELDRDPYERGDPRAVNLRDAIQDDDNFLRATFDDGFESVMELLGRLSDGQPAVNFEHRRSAGFADVDFHG